MPPCETLRKHVPVALRSQMLAGVGGIYNHFKKALDPIRENSRGVYLALMGRSNT